MENKTNDNADSRWVDEQLATLAPPPAWQPDSDAALRRLTQQQPRQRTGTPRLVMAAAILVFTGAIMALLPWKLLWNPSQSETAGVEAPESGIPAIIVDVASPEPKAPGSPPAVAAATARPEPEPTPQLVQIPEVRVPEVPTAQPPRIPTVQPAPEPVLSQTGVHPETPVHQVGSGVTQPRLIRKKDPDYSEDARNARLQGTVELLVVVREDGTVDVREVTKSLGYGLDEKAIAAVSQWRFQPGQKDGQPVPVFISVLINFTLR